LQFNFLGLSLWGDWPALPLSNNCRVGSAVYSLAGTDIRLGGNFICFPVSHVYFFVGGAQIYSQTDWGAWQELPLDSPLSVITHHCRVR